MAVAVDVEALQQPIAAQRSFLSSVGLAARRNPVGAIAALFCIFLIVIAIIGPSIAPHPADKTGFPRLLSPRWDFPMGTDNLFRDMFSRIIVGARNSLGIGFSAVFVSTMLGVFLGVTGGYMGGWWDIFVQRLVEIKLAYPSLIFLIFFISVFQPSYPTVIVAIGIALTPAATRITRSATIGVKHQQYIEAAIAIGNSRARIMLRHVLPNVAAPIIVIASVQIGIAILSEASISFLGLGVSSAQNPSWGRMLQETRSVWQRAWWTAIVPGAAITFAVLAFNLFGDALRDALDPRLRGSR